MINENAIGMMTGERIRPLCYISAEQFEQNFGFKDKIIRNVWLLQAEKNNGIWSVELGEHTGYIGNIRIVGSIRFTGVTEAFVRSLDGSKDYLLYQGKHCSYLMPRVDISYSNDLKAKYPALFGVSVK